MSGVVVVFVIHAICYTIHVILFTIHLTYLHEYPHQLLGRDRVRSCQHDYWLNLVRSALRKDVHGSHGHEFLDARKASRDEYVTTSIHPGAWGGIANALGLWIGFVVPLALSNALWGGKMKLFWLNIGCMLITFIVAGAIIGGWR